MAWLRPTVEVAHTSAAMKRLDADEHDRVEAPLRVAEQGQRTGLPSTAHQYSEKLVDDSHRKRTMTHSM